MKTILKFICQYYTFIGFVIITLLSMAMLFFSLDGVGAIYRQCAENGNYWQLVVMTMFSFLIFVAVVLCLVGVYLSFIESRDDDMKWFDRKFA